MGLREKVTLILTVVLSFQITISDCVPSASRKDALERYLEAKGIKTTKAPFVTSSNVKMNKNASLKKSMIRAYHFPETEYPSDASTRNYYNLGKKSNTNSFGSTAKEVPDARCKAVEDLKKDMRMKRKLDKIHDYQTSGTGPTFTKSLSGPESIILTNKEVFPEVQYPLNAIETWAPHYWNPPTVTQNELEYERPEFPIFSQKVSDKNNKSFAPYKRQLKSKVKQFMEDIDILNQKMHSSKSQSQETRDLNTKKDSCAIFNNDFGDFNKLDSNNSNISNTTNGMSNHKLHKDFVNTITPENQDLKGMIIELYPTNNSSLQPVTSQFKSNIRDVIPIPYKIQEENNFCSKSEHENVRDEDIHTFTEERDATISKVKNITNTPQYSKEKEIVEEFKLHISLNSTVNSDLQPTAITASNTNTSKTTKTEYVDQNYSGAATISNDDPVNVNIPLPEFDIYDQTSPDRSIKNKTQLSDTNGTPRTTIIVVPVDDYVNMMQMPIFEKNTGASIIVLSPTRKKNDTATKTSTNTLHTLPLIDESNTIIPSTKAMTPDFEMLPNNSMCHVMSPNEVKSTNMTKQHYNGTEFTDAILLSEDISSYNTPYLCTTNSGEPHSESVLPNTILFNIPTPLSNDLLNTMPPNIRLDSSFMEKSVVTTASSEDPTDKAIKQVRHYTSFEPIENSASPSLDHVDPSPFNIGNREQHSQEIDKPSDIHNEAINKTVYSLPTGFSENNPIRPVNKVYPKKSVNDLDKHVKLLPDSQFFNFINGIDFHDDYALLHTTKRNESSLEDQTSAYNQDIVISKDLEIPMREDFNISLNYVTIADDNTYKHMNNAYVSNTEEEEPKLPKNNQILGIPLTHIAKNELPINETFSESPISKRKKSYQQLLKDESIPNNRIIDLTKGIQVGSESINLLDAPRPVINLIDPIPIKVDSLLTKHDNLEDTTYLNGTEDTMTLIMVNDLQQNETHSTTADTNVNDRVTNDKEFIDTFHQAIQFSTIHKNKLPFLANSEYEGTLTPDSDIKYSDSFTDVKLSMHNTDFDNDEQSLSDDNKVLDQIKLEQEADEAIYLVPNGILTVPANVDDIIDIKNNSKVIEYQDTVQSHIRSAESFSSDIANTEKETVSHVAEENMSVLPIENNRNEVIENKSLFDIPPLSCNKSLESLSVNEGLTGTAPNDISEVDMPDNESIKLLDSNDKAIQEIHTSDISPELFHMPLFLDKSEPDIFIGSDKRLLARNTLTDHSGSDTKEIKTLPATQFTDIVNSNSPTVGKQIADKLLNVDMMDTFAVNKPFDANPPEVSNYFKPSLVDETLADAYDDEGPLQMDNMNQISPSSIGNIIQNGITPVTRLLVSIDKNPSSSSTAPSYLIKYLYTTL